jgi:hypothetical protein
MAIHGALQQIGRIPRHCETTMPNDTCAYLRYGCRGCENSHHPKSQSNLERAAVERRVLGLPANADGIDFQARLSLLSRAEWIAREAECYDRRLAATIFGDAAQRVGSDDAQ